MLYTLAVIRPPSANADLVALVTSSGTMTPGFAASTLTYNMSVANAVASLTVTATSAHSMATITVNGASVTSGTSSASTSLVEGGTTTFTVRVTAQDGSTWKTTTLHVARVASANADLSALTTNVASSPLMPTFSSSQLVYTMSVAANVATMTITASRAHALSSLTINGATVACPSLTCNPSGTLSLPAGTSSWHTVVHAQNGTMQTYTLTVTKSYSTNAKLVSLNMTNGAGNSIGVGAFAPSFDSATTSYTVSVDNAVAQAKLAPTKQHAGALIEVNGVPVTSGTFSAPLALASGAQTSLTALVTAQVPIPTMLTPSLV